MRSIKIHFIVDMNENTSNFCPHLGIGYLSAYLKSVRPDVLTSVSNLDDDIAADVVRIKPDILAVSATSRYFVYLSDKVTELKKKINIPVIWGGVHITISPFEFPESADVCVLGEGEESFAELLSKFNGTEFYDLESVKGIVFRNTDGNLVVTDKRAFIEPLDRVPFPDLDLLNVRWNRHRRGVIITSRGCPYKCRFCASSLFWDRTRLHSAEYVIEEMLAIVRQYGVRELLIYDDFFTVDRNRIARIVELKKQCHELNHVKFECLSRIDNFDDILARHLGEMGVNRVSFGIESGCQRTLDYLKNGKLRLDQVEKSIGVARAAGLQCVGSFIIGSPFETEEEIEETFEFIERLRLDSVQIAIATPFPGTELWKDVLESGRITGDEWSDNYYTLFGVDPRFDAAEALRGKTVVTGIERDRFVRLVEKGAKIQCRVNFGFSYWFKYYVGSVLIACGLGFLLKIYRKIIDR